MAPRRAPGVVLPNGNRQRRGSNESVAEGRVAPRIIPGGQGIGQPIYREGKGLPPAAPSARLAARLQGGHGPTHFPVID